MMSTFPKWLKWGLMTFGFLVLVNLLYLNYRILTMSPIIPQSILPSPLLSVEDSVGIGAPSTNTGQSVDPVWILTNIKEATASLTKKVDTLVSNSSTKQAIIPKSTSNVKEYYIPLGTGATVNTEWTDITGAEGYLAPSNYGSIKEMYFEASLRIPTGNGRVYARIKNVTDGVSLFESEIYQDGTNSGLVSSGKIPVPTGTKLFRVQLKSTIGSQVLLESSRIKIFVN